LTYSSFCVLLYVDIIFVEQQPNIELLWQS
jgi:hypothetical protein